MSVHLDETMMETQRHYREDGLMDHFCNASDRRDLEQLSTILGHRRAIRSYAPSCALLSNSPVADEIIHSLSPLSLGKLLRGILLTSTAYDAPWEMLCEALTLMRRQHLSPSMCAYVFQEMHLFLQEVYTAWKEEGQRPMPRTAKPRAGESISALNPWDWMDRLLSLALESLLDRSSDATNDFRGGCRSLLRRIFSMLLALDRRKGQELLEKAVHNTPAPAAFHDWLDLLTEQQDHLMDKDWTAIFDAIIEHIDLYKALDSPRVARQISLLFVQLSGSGATRSRWSGRCLDAILRLLSSQTNDPSVYADMEDTIGASFSTLSEEALQECVSLCIKQEAGDIFDRTNLLMLTWRVLLRNQQVWRMSENPFERSSEDGHTLRLICDGLLHLQSDLEGDLEAGDANTISYRRTGCFACDVGSQQQEQASLTRYHTLVLQSVYLSRHGYLSKHGVDLQCCRSRVDGWFSLAAHIFSMNVAEKYSAIATAVAAAISTGVSVDESGFPFAARLLLLLPLWGDIAEHARYNEPLLRAIEIAVERSNISEEAWGRASKRCLLPLCSGIFETSHVPLQFRRRLCNVLCMIPSSRRTMLDHFVDGINNELVWSSEYDYLGVCLAGLCNLAMLDVSDDVGQESCKLVGRIIVSGGHSSHRRLLFNTISSISRTTRCDLKSAMLLRRACLARSIDLVVQDNGRMASLSCGKLYMDAKAEEDVVPVHTEDWESLQNAIFSLWLCHVSRSDAADSMMYIASFAQLFDDGLQGLGRRMDAYVDVLVREPSLTDVCDSASAFVLILITAAVLHRWPNESTIEFSWVARARQSLAEEKDRALNDDSSSASDLSRPPSRFHFDTCSAVLTFLLQLNEKGLLPSEQIWMPLCCFLQTRRNYAELNVHMGCGTNLAFPHSLYICLGLQNLTVGTKKTIAKSRSSVDALNESLSTCASILHICHASFEHDAPGQADRLSLVQSIWDAYLSTASEEPAALLLEAFGKHGGSSLVQFENSFHFGAASQESHLDSSSIIRSFRFEMLRLLLQSLERLDTGAPGNADTTIGDLMSHSRWLAHIVQRITGDLEAGVRGHSGGLTYGIAQKMMNVLCVALQRMAHSLPHLEPAVSTKILKECMASVGCMRVTLPCLGNADLIQRMFTIVEYDTPFVARQVARKAHRLGKTAMNLPIESSFLLSTVAQCLQELSRHRRTTDKGRLIEDHMLAADISSREDQVAPGHVSSKMSHTDDVRSPLSTAEQPATKFDSDAVPWLLDAAFMTCSKFWLEIKDLVDTDMPSSSAMSVAVLDTHGEGSAMAHYTLRVVQLLMTSSSGSLPGDSNVRLLTEALRINFAAAVDDIISTAVHICSALLQDVEDGLVSSQKPLSLIRAEAIGCVVVWCQFHSAIKKDIDLWLRAEAKELESQRKESLFHIPDTAVVKRLGFLRKKMTEVEDLLAGLIEEVNQNTDAYELFSSTSEASLSSPLFTKGMPLLDAIHLALNRPRIPKKDETSAASIAGVDRNSKKRKDIQTGKEPAVGRPKGSKKTSVGSRSRVINNWLQSDRELGGEVSAPSDAFVDLEDWLVDE